MPLKKGIIDSSVSFFITEANITALSSEQLDAFYCFATGHISSGGPNYSMVELAAIWEEEVASASEEIRCGYENMQNGLGVPFEEVVQKLRQKYNISKNV